MDRKKILNMEDESSYNRWCMELWENPKTNRILYNGKSVASLDESIISGNIKITEEHKPKDDFEGSLRQKFVNLFNGSYKTFMRNIALLLKRRNANMPSYKDDDSLKKCKNNINCLNISIRKYS
ncbi:hypothetical protein GWI33_007102 [Rhynchophorus ferrugineus]|uniref:Uncharacterized protein n=1 Tax=Rhynchophorus ferrugineus TaxID=354439 RepID=A0A834IKS1_RHYFE|nr:hypothetical protein GWI33_007102 [Rhynchophorus ferrugineus]